MGDVAEIILDGTVCECCGEFMGDLGDGFPRYCSPVCAWARGAGSASYSGPSQYKFSARHRNEIQALGVLVQNDAYHWQVRHKKTGAVLVDWWPHKDKYRIGDLVLYGPVRIVINKLKGSDHG